MKKQSLLIFFAVSLFFVGCTIEKRHYNSGYHVEWLSQNGKVKKAEPVAQPEKENEQSLAVKQEDVPTTKEALAETSVAVEPINAPMANETVAETATKTEMKRDVQKRTEKKETTRNQMKVEKSNTTFVEKGFIAESTTAEIDAPSSPDQVELIVLIILAILLPPLAVFLHSGISTKFWISILLWICFILPGVIYALLVVTDTI